MTKLEKLIEAVALILAETEPPSEEALRAIVDAQAMVLGMIWKEAYSDHEKQEIVRLLQTRFAIRMEIGTMFQATDYQPWLAARQGDIDWYYWNRYRRHLLTTKGFSPHVVRTLDTVTDKILDHLEDPSKDGSWTRRGLVVGHVQSGKTANYAGLVCKAADAGYRVIIILAGVLNSLRNQTQERIDSDFMGFCTKLKEYIGVSKFDSSRRPVCFTTSIEDFKRRTADSIAMGLEALNEPVVLVLKKNKSTLENLHRWLHEHNRHNLKKFSMLLVDDEADNASINTNIEDKSPTSINSAIRDVLSLFDRSSMVGYTATPFANIFIDPETESEMKDGELYKDIFPKDFILSLDPPDNYIGPDRIFTEEADLDCIRPIADNLIDLPLGHKITFVPSELPDSLINSIYCFILAKSIRLQRGHRGKNHSMMINASRFTGVQNHLKGLVSDEIKAMRQSIGNYGALPKAQAFLDGRMESLYLCWEKEYSASFPDWDELQKSLKEAIDPVEVICINSSSADALDYGSANYPNGRSLVAVGGLGLSRGLTLEGLLVSYFLRNSIMYDTLMQMGRWFGYRDGYEDLCRIFMTPEASSWYSHIADATNELRADFKDMERAKLTPLEFGLRVRSHPTALIVTARNKMRTSREVPVSISLAGRLAETSVLLAEEEHLVANRLTLENLILRVKEEVGNPEATKLGPIWRNVPSSFIEAAVSGFRNHPECLLTYAEPLIEYIDWLATTGYSSFNLLLRSIAAGSEDSQLFAGESIVPAYRVVPSLTDRRIEFSKRRVASKGDERAGLSDEAVQSIRALYNGKNPPDKIYRQVEGRPPLFMVMPAAISSNKDDEAVKTVLTYGISFSGDSGTSKKPQKLVQYRVNTVWWEKNFYVVDEEEDGE